MLKITFTFITLLLAQSLFAYEVPASLKALLKNKKEQLYVGSGCEMKVFENAQGFHIDAYERDGNGEINQDYDFGRFTLNESYELYDFWQHSYGFEAVSRYFSDQGASFDRMATMLVEKMGDKNSVEITFKKSNGFFMYTYYHFECDFVL
jgi:hypothetical protein